MNGLIYLVGLVAVSLFILSCLGRRSHRRVAEEIVMALAETRAVIPMTGVTPHIHWGPVIAGAIAAAAVSFVLLTFGTALGLALASPSPTWRDASVWLWLTTGLFLVLTALASFALGGYLAGRLRTKWGAATPDEVDFRDGAHGLLVWALAV